ncbi:XdhC family protein [Halosimplex salinum]|uniref:XdhC family protein n=1 Tax=Halosimplex salinum TaxID=1710538 RepID=UPI000F4616AC|nr:XdhC/CoxI family protein [Halosimplex salinum]
MSEDERGRDATTAPDWTAPAREVRATAREFLESGEPAVLATVVAVEGRAYRRPGAKMVVAPETDESGTGGAGSVTAGCLADDLRKLARDVLADGTARLERFDLGADGETWGLGVGCDGVVDVLLEPLGKSHRPMLASADELDSGRIAAVVVESDDDSVDVGDRWTSNDGGVAGELPSAVVAEIPDDLDGTATVRVETEGGAVRLFVERVRPPPRLVVVGSNADVRPVVDLARSAGFRVTVVGFRGGKATADRFPRADRVVSTSPRDLREAVDLAASDSVVLMTHNFVDDQIALGELLATPVEYVGVMGPSDRFERLSDALASDGRGIDDADRERIYAPVGLDLGGGSPYQVAHSIVAEALAVRNGRPGGHLRTSDRPIHGRDQR